MYIIIKYYRITIILLLYSCHTSDVSTWPYFSANKSNTIIIIIIILYPSAFNSRVPLSGCMVSCRDMLTILTLYIEFTVT